MRVALYGRVSTTDRDQEPEVQLGQLREYCTARGWTVTREYMDRASALDTAHRREWRRLMDDAARRRFDLVLVWKLDRAFRSVKHLHDSLEIWRLTRVEFTSLRESIDTTTPIGRLMMNVIASMAEFELDLIRERVTAGMRHVAMHGPRPGKKAIGRPRVETEWGMPPKIARVLPEILAGRMSKRAGMRALDIGHNALERLIREAS